MMMVIAMIMIKLILIMAMAIIVNIVTHHSIPILMIIVHQVSFNVRVSRSKFSAPDRTHLSSRPNQLQVAI